MSNSPGTERTAWLETMQCGHSNPPEYEPGKPYGKAYVGQYVTCFQCQGQRKVISVAEAPPVQCPPVAEMDDETFVKHINARHKPSLAGMNQLPPPDKLGTGVAAAYRAYHERLHNEIEGLAHFHREA